MPTVLYPNVGSMHNIGLMRTDLANCKVKLFKNNYTPQPTTVLGDLTEADFGGYAAETVVALLPAYIDPAGGASAQIATIQFDSDGTAPANLVYGAWVETAAGVLILVTGFDAPVQMELVGQSLPLDIKFNFGN